MSPKIDEVEIIIKSEGTELERVLLTGSALHILSKKRKLSTDAVKAINLVRKYLFDRVLDN